MKVKLFAHYPSHNPQYSVEFVPLLQALNNYPAKITAAALLEVGRDDLLKYVGVLESYSIQCMLENGLPHLIDNNFSKQVPLEDWALIEKAMFIGYKAFNLPYECQGCEDMFNQLGVKHDFQSS